jgi:hypothetical protein
VRRRNRRGAPLPSRVPDSGLSCFHDVSAYCVIHSRMLMFCCSCVSGVTTPSLIEGIESRSRCKWAHWAADSST